MSDPSKPDRKRLRKLRFLEDELVMPKIWLARLFAQSRGDHHKLERILREGLLGRQVDRRIHR